MGALWSGVGSAQVFLPAGCEQLILKRVIRFQLLLVVLVVGIDVMAAQEQRVPGAALLVRSLPSPWLAIFRQMRLDDVIEIGIRRRSSNDRWLWRCIGFFKVLIYTAQVVGRFGAFASAL